MLTLGTVGGISAMSMGGSKAKKAQGPPLNAESPDEETFIKYVIRICSYKSGEDFNIYDLKALLTFSREFLKNAEEDGKSGNNVDSTKKDAGR